MSKDYKIQINADVAVPQQYEYAVGSITPTYQKSAIESESNMPFTEALGKVSFPYKLGVFTKDKIDMAIRAFDQNDDMVNSDPDFDPVKLWKQYKLSDRDFYHIQKMDNMEQFNNFMSARVDALETQKRIRQSGVIGNIAGFGVEIFSDPTTYLSFAGATKLLKAGSSAITAGAAVGGAGALAYEASQQLIDVPELRTATDSAVSVAAGVVIGGGLGAASSYFSKARDKGLLVNKNPDFNVASKQYVDELQGLETRADSVGAMATDDLSKGTAIRGRMARGAAWAMRPLGLKTRGQTMVDPEARLFVDKLVGRTAQTEADVAGVAAQENLSNVVQKQHGKYFSKVYNGLDEVQSIIQSTKQVLTEDVKKEALLKLRFGKFDPQGNGLSDVLARQMDDAFRTGWAKDLKDVGADWFKERQNYFPSIMLPEKISKNIAGFADKWNKILLKAKQGAQNDILQMTQQLSRMEAVGASVDEIAEMMEDIRLARTIAEEAELDTLQRARNIAHLYASGMAHNEITLNADIRKFIPNRMKERVLDPAEFIDFIETDPHKLMISYTLEMAPYYASQKLFGGKDPTKATKALVDNLTTKMTEAATAGDTKLAKKLLRDIKDIQQSIPKAWDEFTGQTAKAAQKLMGDTALTLIQASKDFTYMAKMGAQTLSSLPDLAAIGIAHGISGQKEFARILTKFATSPDIRKMSVGTAGAIGVGLDVALRSFLSEIARNDFLRMAAGGGASYAQYIGKAAQIGANTMQFANGSLLYDTIVRRALVVAQQQIIKDSLEQAVAGKAGKEAIADLAFLGIGKADYKKVLAYANKYGETVDGVFFMNPEKWGDKVYGEKMLTALLRDNSRISLRPGVGDTPHAFKVPGINLLTQFKSWSVTATQTYGLQALQKQDMNHRAGIVTVIGMAAAASVFRDWATGKEPVTDPDELLWQGITNSGIVGIIPDFGGNFFARKWFDIESGGAKYGAYQDAATTAMGPLASTIKDVAGALRPATEVLGGEDPRFNDAWIKDMLDIMPIPFVKGLAKEYFTN